MERPDSMEMFRMYKSSFASGAKVLSSSSSSHAHRMERASSCTATRTISRSPLYSFAAYRSARPFSCTAARTIS
eukprot:534080-Amphidinium_carterae.1